MRILPSVPLICALVGVSCVGGAGAQEARRIEWLRVDFPPFYVLEGPAEGQGIGDGIGRFLQAELSGWEHFETVSTVEDSARRFRAGEHVCSTSYIRTEPREKFMHFSIPDMIVPPNGITVRRADLERFGGGGEVVLDEVMRNPALKLMFAQGRSYGTAVDEVLNRHRASAHIYARLDSDRTIFRALLGGSADYILGFPYEAVFHARELGVEGEVVSLPISENREYTLASVACSKTPWGASAIAEIDAALRRLRPRDEYRDAIGRWLGEELQEEFRRRYAEALLGGE